MAILNLTHKSQALGKQTNVIIMLPDKIEGQLKILYLLHGLSDNYEDWLYKTAVYRDVLASGKLAVVCPDGGKSFYSNMKGSHRYYDYISKELPEFVEKLIPTSGKREDRYIAGLSMGGYGALKIAMKNPENYVAAASFSGVTDVKYRYSISSFDMSAIYDGEIPDDEDLFYLAKNLNSAEIKPEIYQWCGLSDFMYEDNVRFRDLMNTLDFKYTYKESEGEHTWVYWDKQISRVIELFKL